MIIKDLDFLTMAFKNDEFCHSTHYFDYVRLLMEDLRSDDALAVLNSQRIDDEEITDNIIWNELFIQALIEEGRKRKRKPTVLQHSLFNAIHVFIICTQKPLKKMSITALHS
jgi:hypothetical protein